MGLIATDNGHSGRSGSCRHQRIFALGHIPDIQHASKVASTPRRSPSATRRKAACYNPVTSTRSGLPQQRFRHAMCGSRVAVESLWMNPKRKIAQIDRLAEAIGYIATDFERFGGLFLDALLEVPMNHQGTNLVGYPVGGVVIPSVTTGGSPRSTPTPAVISTVRWARRRATLRRVRRLSINPPPQKAGCDTRLSTARPGKRRSARRRAAGDALPPGCANPWWPRSRRWPRLASTRTSPIAP
jgi:hypothetical protein